MRESQAASFAKICGFPVVYAAISKFEELAAWKNGNPRDSKPYRWVGTLCVRLPWCLMSQVVALSGAVVHLLCHGIADGTVEFDGEACGAEQYVSAGKVTDALDNLTYRDPVTQTKVTHHAYCFAHVGEHMTTADSRAFDYIMKVIRVVHTDAATPWTFNIPGTAFGGPAGEWYHSALHPELLEREDVQLFLKDALTASSNVRVAK